MSKRDHDSWDLTRPGFTRGMLEQAEREVIAQEFASCIECVLGKIDDGKEATVYLCRTMPGTHESPLLAVKMYRARKFRAFANDSHYANPGRERDRRMAKALRQRSRKGVHVAHLRWVDREWDALVTLDAAGASVPRPHLRCENGILMEYLGDADGRAPSLAEVRLDAAAIDAAWRDVLHDLNTLLSCGLVHGDLSAYNVLYHDGRARMIDLPQSMPIADMREAWSFFHRDVANVCRHFERQGLSLDALDVAVELWRRHGYG